MKHVARIPLNVVAELSLQGINIMDSNDWPKVAAKLDSSEWKAWRTSEGTISKRPYREYLTTRGGK